MRSSRKEDQSQEGTETIDDGIYADSTTTGFIVRWPINRNPNLIHPDPKPLISNPSTRPTRNKTAPITVSSVMCQMYRCPCSRFWTAPTRRTGTILRPRLCQRKNDDDDAPDHANESNEPVGPNPRTRVEPVLKLPESPGSAP